MKWERENEGFYAYSRTQETQYVLFTYASQLLAFLNCVKHREIINGTYVFVALGNVFIFLLKVAHVK